MGINYYLVPTKLYEARDEVSKIVGRTGEDKLCSLIDDEFTRYIAQRYHIGKKSFGWNFHFKQTKKWNCWDELKKEMESGNYTIVDSYDIKYLVSDIIDIIEDSYLNKNNKGFKDTKEGYEDKKGYWFSSDFFY